MNAWQRLLAASSLAIGNAWDLVTHPKTGGAGTVVSNGATISLTDVGVTAMVAPGVTVTVAAPTFTAAVVSPQIAIITTPGIAVTISPTQIQGVSP